MKYKIISLVLFTAFTLQGSSVLSTVGFSNGIGYTFFSGYYNPSVQHRNFVFDAHNNMVVVLSAEGRGAIVRYGSTGMFDTTFNQTGYLKDESDHNSEVYHDIGIAQNSDIIVVGGTTDGKGVIKSYTNTGTPKSSFNMVGYVVNTDASSYQGIVIDSSNRAIAVGNTMLSKGLIACYTMAGQVDMSFGTGGYVIEDDLIGFSVYNKVILDASGRIIVAGIKNNDQGESKGFIACYSSNGELDTTFNTAGRIDYATANFVPNAQNYNQLILDKKGRIVVVGRTDQPRAIIARYTTNGALDTTFNGVGYVLLPEGATDCYGLVIDNRNCIIVSGPSNIGGFMACYTEDGMLDTIWNNSGYFNPKVSSFSATYQKLGIDSNGKIIAVGEAAGADAVTARYFPNGLLDSASSWDSHNFRVISEFNNTPIGILSSARR